MKTILDDRIESSSIRQIEIRPFNLPSIRFSAEICVDMIDWETSFITEPPSTRYFSKEVLINCVRAPLEIPAYPRHTQAVERTIQSVAKSSCSVAGEDARRG
ncbi:hypothetical protein LOD99_15494 [Oopsacas minuta]|uniref:Uncharacterized protein n=1 Tax=Oopsacas minuta TaxID=111878 RepID=A0AAV7KBZ6_9METZ|nr:hypothetical protein LOD99_15494 [Oopsacas minuta]